MIFADLVLPGIDGFGLCKRLRSQKAFDRSVIFAYSGLSDTPSVAKAADAGFDYFAVKPLAPDFFWSCVFAPRQDRLILLSETLIARSQDLIEQGTDLFKRSRIARERSKALIVKLSQRYQRE